MKRIHLAIAATLACGLASAEPIAAGHGQSLAPKANALATENPVRPDSILYIQNGTDSGISIVSQDFEPTLDAYDAQAADDFALQAAAKVTEIDVVGGYFNGTGPARSFHVTFYRSKNGKPGTVLGDYPGLAFTQEGGTFKIPITPAWIPKCCRAEFVSVQAEQDFCCGRGQAATSSGEWGWESQTTVVGAPAVWRNPGDGFATGCTTYTTETTCFPMGQGDHMFTIRGKLKGKGR